MRLKTAIVILNWNGQKLLERFLPGLIDSITKDSELFIIDNKSDDNSVEFLQEIKPDSADDSTLTMDDKDFGIGAQILHQLKIQKLSLLSNSDQIKRVGLAGYGLEIVEYVGY